MVRDAEVFFQLLSNRTPSLVRGLIGWLGYANSLLNPIIYTVFNPDFRRAFRRILRLDPRADPAAARGNGGGGGPTVPRSRDIERSQNEARQPVAAAKSSSVFD